MDSSTTTGSIRKQHITEFGLIVQIVYGDVFADKVDAIVNGEANSQLVLSGTELLKRGGTSIQKECTSWVQKFGKLVDVSKCAITTAGNLPAKFVIHSPGVIWYRGRREEERKLRDAVYHCLECAHQKQLKTISFPPMSVTPLYSFPRDKCAKNVLEAVMEWIKFRSRDTTIACIQFVSTDDACIEEFIRQFNEKFKEETEEDASNENALSALNEEDNGHDKYEDEKDNKDNTAILAKNLKINKERRGLKRENDDVERQRKKSKRTIIEQDAMQMTQDNEKMQMTQNSDIMQMTQLSEDMMSLSGASLAVDNDNNNNSFDDLFL